MSFRVLSAEIVHETNTFNIYPTTVKSFQDRYMLDGDQALATRGDKNTELAGLRDAGRDHGWEIKHIISAAAGPGGVVTRQAFDALTADLIKAADGPWDGIFLMLHGAMVTDFCEDGEGEILRRLRAITGPDLPIAVTLDPHANVTVAMCDLAQILLSFTLIPMSISAQQDVARRSCCSAPCPATSDLRPCAPIARCWRRQTVVALIWVR